MGYSNDFMGSDFRSAKNSSPQNQVRRVSVITLLKTTTLNRVLHMITS